MKIYSLNKIARLSVILLLLTSMGFLYSCKKDNSATPMISSVRLLDSTARDSIFTETMVGNLIVINGSGFDGVMNVYFNNVEAPFNAAIASNTAIILRIPSDAPTSVTDPTVPNTIRVVTTHGEASFNFKLLLPPPIITSVSNENAVAGSTITITGDKLYLTKIVFPGNKEVSTFSTNSTATQVSVVVPAGITTSGPLQLVGTFGTSATVYPFASYAAPSTGFLANFEDGDPHFGWQYWGGNKTNSGFTNNTGNFIQVHPTSSINAGDGSWYGDNRAVMVAGGPWVAAADMGNSIDNYALKFEINVKTPWKNGSLMIAPNGNFDQMARYAPWETSGGTFQTNGWVTATIPLNKFLKGSGSYNPNGAPAANFAALTGGTNSASLQIMLFNDSSTPLTAFDAGIDNVRIVKVQ